MRQPLRKAMLWLLLALAGGALFVVADRRDELDNAVRLALAAAGAVLGAAGAVALLRTLPSAFGEIRLRSGIGLLARWRVPPDAWNAFGAFDTHRAGMHATMQNVARPRRAGRGAKVVRFGRQDVLVDGFYQRLSRYASPQLRGVVRLQLPGAPEAIEFGLAFTRVRFGQPPAACLRVPVPEAARPEAQRVLDHYRTAAPEPLPNLSERHPWLVIGAGVGTTVLLGGVAALAWHLRSGGDSSLKMLLLMLSSGVFAAGAALFTVIVGLMILPWGQPRE